MKKSPPPKTEAPKTLTPLMRQYLQIKERFPNEIVFFRLGDFYEMFFDDAVRAAPILEVALTKRQSTPMCGIPHHAATGYLAKLLNKGVSVAMAEQLEDPKKTKGMVKRGVVRVITPGTILEEELLPSTNNNFLVSLVLKRSKNLMGAWGLAAVDVSTGRQWIGEVENDCNWNQLKSQLATLNPSEILFIGDDSANAAKDIAFKGVTRLEPFPSTAKGFSGQAAAALKDYLTRHNPKAKACLSDPQILPTQSRGILFLDESAIRHLELVDSSGPERDGPTLFRVLNKTVTPLGSRLLRWWILHPSTDCSAIQARQMQIQDFVDEAVYRDQIRLELKEVSDLERILTRAQAGTVSPRDLYGLKLSLLKMPEFEKGLKSLQVQTCNNHFDGILENIAVPPALSEFLDSYLMDEPPAKCGDGNVIKPGLNSDLDELRELKRTGRKWIAKMEAEEKEKTGITNLKVGYNDVFGYYLEVSKSHLPKVPAEWIRKQTLANAERYITPALKEQEEKILGAQEKIFELEIQLYQELVHEVAAFSKSISDCAEAIAKLDCVTALSQAAVEYGYTRPVVNDSNAIQIKGGRHPVIEKQIGKDRFIANDVDMNESTKRTIVITGPNMAGKSTYLRQTALIVILAQMGSFVPAESAEVGVVDSVFTRIGASDRLAQGQSTFMVEMSEVATLLLNSTPKSLLILDEVGRGTSTYDGVSIAWSVIDYLSNGKGSKSIGPRTLFATHYFELTQLEKMMPGVVNAHATAKEWPGPDGRKQVVFLYQILPGPADRSYGIHVAEMAGVPDACVEKARGILRQLESGSHKIETPAASASSAPQLELFNIHPAVEKLRSLRLDECTPLEALNELAQIKKLADKQ